MTALLVHATHIITVHAHCTLTLDNIATFVSMNSTLLIPLSIVHLHLVSDLIFSNWINMTPCLSYELLAWPWW